MGLMIAIERMVSHCLFLYPLQNPVETTTAHLSASNSKALIQVFPAQRSRMYLRRPHGSDRHLMTLRKPSID